MFLNPHARQHGGVRGERKAWNNGIGAPGVCALGGHRLHERHVAFGDPGGRTLIEAHDEHMSCALGSGKGCDGKTDDGLQDNEEVFHRGKQ